MLNEVNRHLKPAIPYVSSSYLEQSYLMFNGKIIPSEEGVQQGDPLGPLLFCLTLQPIIKQLSSPLNLWYMDDGILGGTVDSIKNDYTILIEETKRIGLLVNQKKCEIYNCNEQCDLFHQMKTMEKETFSLLGSPVTKENSELLLTKKQREINQLAEKLKILPAHHAYKILQVSLGSPNLISILRSSPSHDINTLKKIDASLKENLEETLNVTLTDEKWSQASLPIKFGGLGIRKPSDLAIPCYIASFLSAKSTNSKITNNSIFEQYWAWYIDQTQKDVPAVRQSQKLLDENLIKIKFNRLRQNLTGTELSRITSASHKRAGDWLKAVPQMKLGVFLNNDEFRHAVSLRLGLPIFEKIDCVCGEEIDAFGHHCFVCNRNNEKILRHTMVNECVSRALKSAGLPNKMEPRYLAYDKGLRPDGVTQIPFQRGKCLTWDVSCPHPLCVSHIKCNNSSGKLSTICEELKQKKYSCLEENYIFSPIIIDTIGAYGSQTETTIKEIGARIRKKSGSLIATSQYRQQLSINLQKGNHLCFNLV